MLSGIIAKTTEFPLQLIGSVAGVSTARGGSDDDKAKRARRCFKREHMSVFEHVSVTWRIEGISRACSHQLVRHRLASFCQLSQRYVVVNTDADWYVIPPSIRDDDRMLEEYASEMWRYSWFRRQQVQLRKHQERLLRCCHRKDAGERHSHLLQLDKPKCRNL